MNLEGKRTKKGGIFTARGVSYILRNPIYAGYTRWSPEGRNASERRFDPDGFIIAKGTHRPLIREEAYLAASALLSRIGRCEGRNSGKDYMLRGLLKCGNCGSAMVLCHGNILRCANYESCRAPTVSYERVSSTVKSTICELFPTLFVFSHNYHQIMPTSPQYFKKFQSSSSTLLKSKTSIQDFLSSKATEKEKNTLLSVILEKVVFFGESNEIVLHFHK
jgi:hypothetical protein